MKAKMKAKPEEMRMKDINVLAQMLIDSDEYWEQEGVEAPSKEEKEVLKKCYQVKES